LSFLFDKVGGSAAAFNRDDDPPVKQIVLSQFIVRHELASDKH